VVNTIAVSSHVEGGGSVTTMEDCSTNLLEK